MASVAQADNREFLVEKVLKNYSNIFDKATGDKLALLKRQKVERPVIFVGTATCGVMAGAEQTCEAVAAYLSKNRIDAELVRVGCTGLCSDEPLLDVQMPGKARISFRKAIAARVEDILDPVFHRTIPDQSVIGQYRQPHHESWPNVPMMDQHPFFARQHRIVLRNAGIVSPHEIGDYIAHGGYKSLYKTVLNYTADKVCEIIDQSELRGRGGGGFPTGKKWWVTLGTGSDQKYLVCNADESDPGAFMNRAILEGDPHRVIEGVAIAAYAIGASNAFIYLRSDYTRPLAILRKALEQAREYGLTGQNIFGSGFNLNIHLRLGAGAFVCGEETAMIASLEGRRGLPQSKPPYPAEKGLFGHPTVVNNVETLANVPAILENGPSWFRSVGTRESKGTKVFSVTGRTVHSGFIEIPMGTTLNEIVRDITGGMQDGKKLKAVQIGGPSGVCIPVQGLDVAIGYETLHEAEAPIGLGGLIILDEGTCMVSLSRYFMEFLRKESCGKCIPCREGTSRMLQILDEVTRRPRAEGSHETLERFKGVVELESLAEVIRDTSLCGLGQNAPNPVLSSLKWFRDEFEEHIFDRRCRAGVCHDLRTYSIDPMACTGCNVCQKKCPESAIIGSPKLPHFIIEARCTGCGLCFESCKFNAIFYK